MPATMWAFVLTGLHLGLHWNRMLNAARRAAKGKGGRAALRMARVLLLGVCAFGVYSFIARGLYMELFMLREFAFLAYGESLVTFAAAYIAVWTALGAAAYALNRLLNGRTKGGIHVKKALILICVSAMALAVPNACWALVEADDMVLISGGAFQMGSPAEEPWRSEDETLHSVAVGSFYMSAHEFTQREYEALMGVNPSAFPGAENPVENVTWYDAVACCNARSVAEGLTPAYTLDGQTVVWNRSADGYRLPTEAEWEYACRAGTAAPFNTETSISVDEANYWGHYPYQIEENYFTQENLETQPGIYREQTVPVGSFAPNRWGLYDMHGNVSEWVWDAYAAYDPSQAENPAGAETGAQRVYRGGAWNDFAKNLRSAYRAAMQPDLAAFNVGLRMVRNADAVQGTATAQPNGREPAAARNRTLIAYFSWGGNTRGIAEEIQRQTGYDLFAIECETPYSDDYDTVLEQAQADQNVQARPALANHVSDMAQYDTIILGYPNWWASIPMPVASFLEEYDLTGKTILPFCSHGGGRFGQSLTAIAKLAPHAKLLEGLAVSYSGGSGLSEDIAQWLAGSGAVMQ